MSAFLKKRTDLEKIFVGTGGEFPVIFSCADIVRMEYIYGLQIKKISAYL